MGIDYDSVAVLYDTYVTADFEAPYVVSEVRRPRLNSNAYYGIGLNDCVRNSRNVARMVVKEA